MTAGYVRILLMSPEWRIVFPKIVMVLEVMSNEGHVMSPDILTQGLRTNAGGTWRMNSTDEGRTCFNKIKYFLTKTT